MINKILVIIAICVGVTLHANWSTDGSYLTKNGEHVFFSGVNYVPSYGWLTHLEIWDVEKVEKDFAALSKIGVKNIRYCPLWHQLQKSKEGGYEPNFQKLDMVIELAGKYGISVQLGLLNSWMSGGVFLPDFANGQLFTDPSIIAAQKNLIRDIVSRYKGNPTIQAYDIGNELNVLPSRMKFLKHSKEEVDAWMAEMYATVKKHDPSHDVINGIGTGYTPSFNIEAISRHADMMATHSYPYFHGTSRMDPWIGLRTTYSTNYIISWAEMVGQPVLMQELGSSEQWMHPRDIAKYMNITFMSNWAEGAAGYVWWCSHDIPQDFKVSDDGLFKEYSTWRIRRQNQFSKLNYDMGILDEHNLEKRVTAQFTDCIQKVEELGVDWKEQLPVCYIFVPESYTYDYERSMIELINPFVLTKQVHLDVKLIFEKDAIPDDAAAVIIGGYKLGENGKDNLREYLESGGTVYQSYYNDFSPNIEIVEDEKSYDHPEFLVSARAGTMDIGQRFLLPYSLKIKKAQATGSAELLVSHVFGPNALKEHHEHDTDLFEEVQGNGVFFKDRIGKGTYYFLAMNLEKALVSAYSIWDKDFAHLFYSSLRPETDFDLSDKQVELYHKTGEKGEIVVLVNHCNENRFTELYSQKTVKLKDYFDSVSYGEGKLFNIDLNPAEVLVLKVE